MTNDDTNHGVRPVVIHEDECEMEGWGEGQSGRGSIRWRTLLSGDRTPSQSLTCGVAEIEPGEDGWFSVHRHAQAEVYHYLSGRGVMTVDGVEHSVRGGSTVFIPGNAKHGVRNTGEEPLRFFYVFEADSFEEVEYEFEGEGSSAEINA